MAGIAGNTAYRVGYASRTEPLRLLNATDARNIAVHQLPTASTAAETTIREERSPHRVACLLTPPGAGALAVIALRGPDVWPLLAPYFQARRHTPVAGTRPTLTFGTLTADGQGDEIILLLQGDASEQYVELQLHGGPGVVAWCLRFLEQLGCQLVPWNEWLPDKTERLLPHALTKTTASHLLDQCGRALPQRLHALKQLPDRQAALQQVNELLRWASLGLHLVTPWKVLLAGPPNVGKSSLLNALVGYQRAITSSIPGTTRDVISGIVVCDGYPIEFLDSAGLRHSEDPLEQAGMAHTRLAGNDADVVLWLEDLHEPSTSAPVLKPALTIGTKADLPRRNTVPVDHVVSAQSGEGVGQLLQKVLHICMPVKPQPGQLMPISLAQIAELHQLRDELTPFSA